jgi:hypothetical protein
MAPEPTSPLISVDRAFRPVRRQDRDDPFDLAPAAEVDDIAQLAASVGARGRFADGMNAEAIDQLGRFGNGRAIRHVDIIEQSFPRLLSGC